MLYTAEHSQLVLMALRPAEDIGAEVHTLDQFFRIEQGTGVADLDGVRTALHAGSAVVVPAGTRHNIINTGADSNTMRAQRASENARLQLRKVNGRPSGTPLNVCFCCERFNRKQLWGGR